MRTDYYVARLVPHGARVRMTAFAPPDDEGHDLLTAPCPDGWRYTGIGNDIECLAEPDAVLPALNALAETRKDWERLAGLAHVCVTMYSLLDEKDDNELIRLIANSIACAARADKSITALKRRLQDLNLSEKCDDLCTHAQKCADSARTTLEMIFERARLLLAMAPKTSESPQQ